MASEQNFNEERFSMWEKCVCEWVERERERVCVWFWATVCCSIAKGHLLLLDLHDLRLEQHAYIG